MLWRDDLLLSYFFPSFEIWVENFSKKICCYLKKKFVMNPNYRLAVGIFRPCSRHISTMVDRARIVFWLCSLYVSTVLEVCFEFVLHPNTWVDYSISAEHWHVLAYDNRIRKWAPLPRMWTICNNLIVLSDLALYATLWPNKSVLNEYIFL